jgi:hypothetical protein
MRSSARDGKVQLGKTALAGWRTKVADAVAGPVAARSPLSVDQVRAIVGTAFFVLSVYYVAGTVGRARKVARGG